MKSQRKTTDGADSISFVVDLVPRSKGRPRLGRGGRVFTPAATRAYEKAFKAQALQAANDNGWRPNEDALHVALSFSMPTRRRVDLDNLVKAALDAMNRAMWVDDSQIVSLHAFRNHDKSDAPGISVWIERVKQ